MTRYFAPTGAAIAAAVYCLAGASPTAAQAKAPPAAATDDAAQADEILIIGRRSGAPMWRVTGENATIVLVGGINGVSKSTKWDPESLMEALRRADRVMFPQSVALTASIFNAFGWLAKWNR